MSRRHKEKTAGTAPAGVMTLDAFSNRLFRLGFGSQAPIEATEYPLTRMTDNYALLNSLYRDNWVVQNVVDIIPADMLREWFTVTGEGIGPESGGELKRFFRRTQLRDRLLNGLRWGRLYGGAAGLLLIRGQEDLSRPLDLSAVLPGSYQGLYVLDRWSGVSPDAELVSDPGDRDFNLPMWYNITDANGRTVTRVHHSRVIRFTGRELPFLEKAAEMYWGESELEALYDDVKKHDNVSHNIANLTFRANTDVMSVQDLDQLLSVAGAEQQRRFWETMQAISVIKSNFGMQLVNREDTVQNTQYTFAGLKDVYDSMCLDLSGASRIPVTKLFGRSPSGLNATGESDLKNYYDYVDTLRESKLRPILEQLLPVILMSALGYVPEDLDIQFPPLWTPTAEEVARIAGEKTQSVIAAFQAGLMDQGAAMSELKKLSDETGMFDSISDEAISAAKGKTYQDVTALRDPLAGILPEPPGGETGGEEAGPFELSAADVLTADYAPGQPRDRNGKWTSGGGSGKIGKTKYAPSPQRNKSGIQLRTKTYARLCGILGTQYPGLKAEEIRTINDGKWQYVVRADGYGGMMILSKEKI